MKSSELRKFLGDLVSGKAFGNAASIAAIGQRMSEENLIPVGKQPVTPLEAARFIIYCAVLPNVAKGLANDKIREYESAWKIDPYPAMGDGQRNFRDTSLWYLASLLSGEIKSIPDFLYIDKMNGNMWTDVWIRGELRSELVEEADFYPGFSRFYRQSTFVVNNIKISKIWLEMLIDKLSK